MAAKKYGQVQGDDQAEVLMRSMLLAETSRIDDALRLLEEATRKTTDEESFSRVSLQRALVLRTAGRINEARAVLEQALDRSPDTAILVDQLARIAWEEQNWDDLEKYELRLSQLVPGQTTMSQFYRGIRLLAQADIEPLSEPPLPHHPIR